MVRKVRRRDLVLLWARAAGMCSHPDCRKKLVQAATESNRAASIGEAAHIVAHVPAGPRGDAPIPADDRDRYANLILLCPNHHSLIDDQPQTYTIDTLRTWKSEHEAWVDASTADTPDRTPWTAIVHEDRRWIYVPELAAALGPGNRIGAHFELRNDPRVDSWPTVAAREWREATVAIGAVPPDRRRFAVFSLGRIPLAVQLGFALGDRSRVELFHYHRDRGTWSWPEDASPTGPISWALTESAAGPSDEAAIRVSLSAEVRPEPEFRCALEIDIRVPDPSVRWLRVPEQLTALAEVYAEALAAIRARSCRRVQLYYAGPAAGAIAFGRAYNPRMNPPLTVYEYRRGALPSYEQALVLNSVRPTHSQNRDRQGADA
jgi:hypothetical protein